MKKSLRRPPKAFEQEKAETLVKPPATESPKGRKLPTKFFYGVVAVLALSALVFANKGMLVAAMVDGKPIFRWELTNVLTDRFGKQTLEGIITEQLIANEAKRQGVTVSKPEVDAKQAEILKTLGANVTIDEFLKYQGITRSDFDNQIKLQLLVQKILGKDVTITGEDVDRYINTNRATLVATTPAELQAEAKQAILDAKVGEKLQTWFAQLKEKAKILRFL